MADIRSLYKSITEMSNEEIEKKLLDIRQKIRVPKQPKTVVVSKAKQETKRKVDLKTLLSGMNPEDRAEFIASITNGK